MVRIATATRNHPRISSFWSVVRRFHRGSDGFFCRVEERDVVLRLRVDDEPVLLLRDDLLDDEALVDERLDFELVLRFVMRLSLYTNVTNGGNW
jgi:hypothetical protein